jgi:hypothetical protein
MKFNEIDLYFLAMTKAALDNATSAMAVELAKHKVGHIHSIYCASHLLRPSPVISQQFISWNTLCHYMLR